MKKLLLLSPLLCLPILAMHKKEIDEDKKAFKEMIFTAAAHGKTNWIKALTGCPGVCESTNEMVNEQGASPLFLACQEGHIETVKALLDEDDDGFHAHAIKIHDGTTIACTPLHMAAACGHTDVVKLLLESLPESDRNKINNRCAPKGRTPLHFATGRYNWDVVKILLAYGANSHQADDEGITPSMLAKNEGDDIYFKFFNETPSLKGYAINKDLAGLKELLAKGEPVDSQDERGHTALSHAIFNLFPEGVEALINAGANLYLDGYMQGSYYWSPMGIFEEMEYTYRDCPDKIPNIKKIRAILDEVKAKTYGIPDEN